MRTVLFFLAELTDQDLDWLAGAGQKDVIPANHVLINKGQAIASLYIVLDGAFAVSVNPSKVIATIRAGEIAGEISFLDARPPLVNVTAIEESAVLTIPRPRLRSKLRSDLGFASRFYLSLGVMLAHRLRDNNLQLAGIAQDHAKLDDSEEQPGEMSPELLDKLNLAATRFEFLMERFVDI